MATNPYENLDDKQRQALEAIDKGTTEAVNAIQASPSTNILNPYDVAGEEAINLYMNANRPGNDMSFIENTPGYQFGKDQLVKGINQQAAYAGKAQSGMNVQNYVAPAIQKYSGDYFQQYLENLKTPISTGLTAAQQSATLAQSGASSEADILSSGGKSKADILTTGASQQIALENLSFQKDQSEFDNRIKAASLTGTYEGTQTLDAIKQKADTDYQSRLLDLEQQKTNLSGRDYDLRKRAIDMEQEQWNYKINDSKASNLLAMIDNGNVNVADLSTEDRVMLAEYKGIPIHLPFTSSKELNDKTKNLNFVWEGLQNGMVTGDTAIKQIADAYGIDAGEINLPDKRGEIVDTYITSMIAMNKSPDMAYLNKIFEGFNAGKESGDKGYMEPFNTNDVLMSDEYVGSYIFSQTRTGKDDNVLRTYLKDAGITFDSGRADAKPTAGNLAKFKDLYNKNTEFKSYIDKNYSPT